MSDANQFDLFVSVNPELKSKVGHPYYLDRSLKEVVETAGIEFLSFGSKDQDDEIRGLNFILPGFTSTSWEVFREGSDDLVAEHVEEFVRMLEGLQGGDRRVLVYWYMGSAEVFHELGRRAAEFSNVVFCLHLFSGFFLEPSSFTTAHMLHAGRLLALLSESGLEYSVVSDSEKLIEALKSTSEIDCSPVPAFASQRFGDRTQDSPKCGKIQIVYPTDDSAKRGFDLLIDFLREHARRFSETLHFSIRVYPGNRKEIDQAFAEQFGNVEFIEGQLSAEDFESLLQEAEVVLLPYLPELFYYRTSSILYEAMALRKPVIVVEDTWLSERVETLGGGWIAKNSRDGLKAVFDEISNGGRKGIQEKAAEISSVPQVEDLFESVLSLPYGQTHPSRFEIRFTGNDVDAYYRSEKEKSRIERDLGDAGREIARLERKTDYLESELNRIINSKTWRYTESLRELAATIKEWRRKGGDSNPS